MRGKVFQYFLVFAAVLTFSFAWQKSSALNSVVTGGANFHGLLLNQSFTSLHLPFESAPTEHDREVPAENENEEDPDNDNNLLEQQQTLFDQLGILDKNDQNTQHSSFIPNHLSVPLFILYHSWKSFLS